MARQQQTMAAVAALTALVVVLSFVAAVDAVSGKGPALPPPKPTLPQPTHTHKYKMINPGKRNQVLTCDEPTDHSKPCVTTCPKRCPEECLVFCPTCATYCLCDFYPGFTCGDPRFTGADGNNFYFHGKKGQDFCIVSDADLHINAHFIGKRNPTMSRDFTWIQSLGIRFADHSLYIGAQKTIKWYNDVDHLELTFDGMPVDIPDEINGRWKSTVVPGLTVTRTSITNGVTVELNGVFQILARVVPITEEDSRIHNYGVTEDDSLAHFDLGFKFYNLTDDVHGVLGQTYRTDYVNKLSVSTNMPLMGGGPSYVSSNIFATDCKVARFGRQAGISMITTRAS